MKLSVIIPLYNAEKYVEKCLDSVLSQRGVDYMEIIVVDDHGQDGSVEVVKRVASTHRRGNCIKLVATEKNSGAWAARNLGISVAGGEWIAFVDADDWCEPLMYADLIFEADNADADWAYCLAQKEFKRDKTKVLRQTEIESGEMTEEKRRVMLTRGVAYFWTAIYRKSFLSSYSIEFPRGKFSEDSYFWWLVVMCSKRVAVVDKVGYHYRIQADSVSKRPDETKAEQKQNMYGRLLSDLKNRGLYDDYREELDYLYVKKAFLIPMMIRAINYKNFNRDEVVKFLVRMRYDHRVEIDDNLYLKNNKKVGLLYICFLAYPKTMSRLLRLRYRQDPF